MKIGNASKAARPLLPGPLQARGDPGRGRRAPLLPSRCSPSSGSPPTGGRSSSTAGPLRQMPLVKLGVFRPRETRTFRFSVLVPGRRDERGRPLPGCVHQPRSSPGTRAARASRPHPQPTCRSGVRAPPSLAANDHGPREDGRPYLGASWRRVSRGGDRIGVRSSPHRTRRRLRSLATAAALLAVLPRRHAAAVAGLLRSGLRQRQRRLGGGLRCHRPRHRERRQGVADPGDDTGRPGPARHLRAARRQDRLGRRSLRHRAALDGRQVVDARVLQRLQRFLQLHVGQVRRREDRLDRRGSGGRAVPRDALPVRSCARRTAASPGRRPPSPPAGARSRSTL